MFYAQIEDGSIYRNDKIIFFSLERFIKDIVKGKCCFICGANPEETEFNDEHVIPKWILRKLELFSKSIVLPNGNAFRYDKYKIPCCKKCNSLLSRKIEIPMSKLLSKGYDNLSAHIEENLFEIFTWLALIFFKVHFKDKEFREFKDLRKPNSILANKIIWDHMHHIHCILRSFYTKPKVSSSVIGSLLILPVSDIEDTEKFDLCTHSSGSMLLKVGDICFITVLNDSCASAQVYFDTLERINEPLTTLQLREVFSKLTHINLLLKDRPEFFSDIDFKDNNYYIGAKIPKKIKLNSKNAISYGAILDRYCGEIVEKSKISGKKKIIKAVKNGEWTFLFNKDGKFIKNKE